MDAKRIAELRELYEKAANALPIATIALGLIARTALPEALDAYEDLQELHELACNSDNAWREKAEALQKENLEYVAKYRQIKLANTEITRNDHVQFGKLMEERSQLQAEVTRLKLELDSALETIGIKAKEWAHSFDDRAKHFKALEALRVLSEVAIDFNKTSRADFHRNVCAQTMGCHCTETSLDKALAKCEEILAVR